MKNMANVIGDVASALITLFKGLVVASVFAAILYTDVPWDGLGNTMNLVGVFLNGGLAGLLTLLLLASWIK